MRFERMTYRLGGSKGSAIAHRGHHIAVKAILIDMAEPTLEEVFGSGATQDASSITIQKAALTGLTASTTNTAESILAAIAVQAKNTLTQENFDSNQDQSITALDGFDSIISRDDGTGTFVSYRQQQITLSFHKVDAGSFDPDDY